MLLKDEKKVKLIEVLELENKNFNLQSYYYAVFSANMHKFLPNIPRISIKKCSTIRFIASIVQRLNKAVKSIWRVLK